MLRCSMELFADVAGKAVVEIVFLAADVALFLRSQLAVLVDLRYRVGIKPICYRALNQVAK